jgi:hypothetical protein
LLCLGCPSMCLWLYCTINNTTILVRYGIRSCNPSKRSRLDRATTGSPQRVAIPTELS